MVMETIKYTLSSFAFFLLSLLITLRRKEEKNEILWEKIEWIASVSGFSFPILYVCYPPLHLRLDKHYTFMLLSYFLVVFPFSSRLSTSPVLSPLL